MSEQTAPPHNGWLGKPGVPLNPEQSGYHRLKNREGDKDFIVEWSASYGWITMLRWSVDTVAEIMMYVGPVLTLAEEAALQKRVAELRQIIRYVAGCEHDTASDEDLLEQVAAAICRMNNIDPTGHISIDGSPFNWAWKHFLPQARAALGMPANEA